MFRLTPHPVDFDFTTVAGLSKPNALPPTLQVAFQYTVLVASKVEPIATAAASASESTGAAAAPTAFQNGGSIPSVAKAAARPPQRFTLQRRLRVATYRVSQHSEHQVSPVR